MRAKAVAVAVSVLLLSTCGSAATSLSGADSAVCAKIDSVMVDFEEGYPAWEALDRNIGGGCPAGQPSDSVHGVVNVFRSRPATEKDHQDGIASYEDTVDSLALAMRAKMDVCGA